MHAPETQMTAPTLLEYRRLAPPPKRPDSSMEVESENRRPDERARMYPLKRLDNTIPSINRSVLFTRVFATGDFGCSTRAAGPLRVGDDGM